MPKYPFLSDEWMEEARRIRDEFHDRAAPVTMPVRMNQVITDVPFGEGTIRAHMDSTGGDLQMELGHLEKPDLTVTLDYETAKAIFVELNLQAGMQAFMSGKIKVEGDLTKLMALQGGAPDAVTAEAAVRIKDITA